MCSSAEFANSFANWGMLSRRNRHGTHIDGGSVFCHTDDKVQGFSHMKIILSMLARTSLFSLLHLQTPKDPA